MRDCLTPKKTTKTLIKGWRVDPFTDKPQSSKSQDKKLTIPRTVNWRVVDSSSMSQLWFPHWSSRRQEATWKIVTLSTRLIVPCAQCLDERSCVAASCVCKGSDFEGPKEDIVTSFSGCCRGWHCPGLEGATVPWLNPRKKVMSMGGVKSYRSNLLISCKLVCNSTTVLELYPEEALSRR